jgi:alpha-L-fucosidase 2
MIVFMPGFEAPTMLALALLAASHANLSYSPRKNLRLDLDTPAGAGPFLTIIAVHGGGWSAGSRADAAPFCSVIVKSGFACAAIDYRTAPATRFPGQIEDLRDAIRFLMANAAQFHLESRGVVLAGESAGGQLVSWLGAQHPAEVPILGVISFSAPMDLVALGEPGRSLGVVPPEVRDLTGATGWTDEDIGRMREASPYAAIRPGNPPFLIFHGQADQLVPSTQSRAFCEQLRSTGNRCQSVIIPRARHGLWSEEQFDRWAPLWQDTLVAWIKGAGSIVAGSIGRSQ